MLINGPVHIQALSNLIYNIDVICREDFKNNRIVSERDYVSNFLNYINRPFGPFSNLSFAYSQTLPSNLERNWGCDGVIVFKRNEEYKIGLFEAKVVKKYWDSLVGRPRISRFQNQINKQALINPNIAVWEMFINKNITGFIFDLYASTCVKSNVAQAYTKSNLLWSYNDLTNLLGNSYRSNLHTPVNIQQIVTEILTCTFGQLQNNSNGISLYENSSELIIPLINNEVTLEDKNRIHEFLTASEIHSYTHIDLSEFVEMNRDFIISNLARQ